ncbi:curved DNA-binding protein CbpA [Candidatus Micrarchaeum sp.]|uniref:J domain-containing protein n=1 Tax=Candidatus Micrarchaeum sp. TaxID=2282148 RepID=UPI00193451FE|nr:J domain-containing protein [Candidatus Micrarchaeum sp.]QRF74155.1 curved DNA-binding protein CbpA [Candidatus Micrarchaeum sp.]
MAFSAIKSIGLMFGRGNVEKKSRALSRKATALEEGIDKEIEYIFPGSEDDKDIKKYFSALGIKPTSDKTKIRSAYISRAKEYHPDISREENAEEMMKLVNEAYSALSEKSLGVDNLRDEKKSVAAMEKLALELYVKLRNSDYDKMVGIARRGVTKQEFSAIVADFCDWNKRFSRVEKAITGRLDKRLKALERHKQKCVGFEQKISRDNLDAMASANRCISGINESLRKGYTVRSYADIAFANARERIMPIEQKQKEILYKSIR